MERGRLKESKEMTKKRKRRERKGVGGMARPRRSKDRNGGRKEG